MAAGASRPLTDRQAAVMERIDRRVPIKVIARELGVSETRVNQHIRALKDLYDVANLRDLVDEYRAEQSAKQSNENNEIKEPEASSEGSDKGLSEPAYSFSQVQTPAFAFDSPGRETATNVQINDVLPLIERAPWLKSGEPKVVPGPLDGEHAVMYRFAAIIGIAFGLLAALVLTVTAAITISDALDGTATIPVDEQGFAVERG